MNEKPKKTASVSAKTARSRRKNNVDEKRKPRKNEAAAQTAFRDVVVASIYEGIASQKAGEDWGAEENAPKAGEAEVKALPRQYLPDNVKTFIVIRNACRDSPSTVVKAVKEVFGIDVSSAAVERYDPTKANGQTLSIRFKQLFRTAQREYQAMVIRAGISDKRWRMQCLHNITIRAMDSGNYVLAMQAMEQAAKEEGGQYTNKSVIQVDEKRQMMARLLQCRPEDIPVIARARDKNNDEDAEKMH